MPLEVLTGARQAIEGLAWLFLAFVAGMLGLELLTMYKSDPAVGISLVNHSRSTGDEIEEILDLICRLSPDQRHLLAEALERSDHEAIIASAV